MQHGPNSWLVNRVIKFGCLGAMLAGFGALAAPSLAPTAQLRVGRLPQISLVRPRNFSHSKRRFYPSLHSLICSLTGNKDGLSHLEWFANFTPLASAFRPYISLTAGEKPTSSRRNKTEIKHQLKSI